MRITLDAILSQEQGYDHQRASVFFVGVCLTRCGGSVEAAEGAECPLPLAQTTLL